jgi:hypothetical protein
MATVDDAYNQIRRYGLPLTMSALPYDVNGCALNQTVEVPIHYSLEQKQIENCLSRSPSRTGHAL